MKYEGLRTHLQRKGLLRAKMTFAEVAEAIGKPLPASAYRYPAWWANDPIHHAQARAWTEAGYRTQNVDLKEQRVEFVRVDTPARGVGEMPKTYDHQLGPPYKVHPAYGALKGVVTIRDWDLTQPAMDSDEYAEYEANLLRKMNEIGKGLRGKK